MQSKENLTFIEIKIKNVNLISHDTLHLMTSIWCLMENPEISAPLSLVICKADF